MDHARLACFFTLALAACAYDPPPEATIDIPPDGAFLVGDPLTLRFSEPIDPATLAIRVWPDARDLEGQIPADVAPLLDTCRLVDTPCGDADLILAEDGTSAEVVLARSTLGAPGLPLILEVTRDLADLGGAARGIPEYFDVQFNPRREPNTEPVDFDDGVYIIVAEIADPLPAVISLVTDIKVIPDGSLAMAAAEADEIGDAPKNTSDPTELEVDSTGNGFALFAWGFVQQTDGARFIDTDPIDVSLSLGVVLVIHDIRITGAIVHDDELDSDRIDGTVSFSGITLNPGDGEANYPAGNKSFAANRVPEALVPAGAPQVCGDLCGAVSAQCEPPFDFPGVGMCP